MRRRSFILGVLMVILGFAAQAQIYEVYRQGFEDGEAVNYTVTGTAASQSSLHVGGSKALKMSHVNSPTVVELNTIDMTSYQTLTDYVLEFTHINNVSPFNCATTEQVAMIEVKLESSDNWTRLTNTYYDKSGSYSSYFEGSGYFCSEAYPLWTVGTPNNDWWMNERFKLNHLFANVAPHLRKLQIRLTLFPKTASLVTGDQGWWLDDIVVKVSPQPIVKPVIHMLKYPDLINYPNSRGATIKISAKAGNATLAINQDSVYLQYRVGHNPEIHKHTMTKIVGEEDQYKFHIPFEGYDTMMYFRVVVKDASTNENMSTMPVSEAAWFEYKCIRGGGNTNFLSERGTLSLDNFPFPDEATAKSEFILDSAMFADAGFRPSAITKLKFVVKSGLQEGGQLRNNMQVRMKNVNTTFKHSTELKYTDDYIQTVYSGDINFPIVFNNNTYELTLQDTFCYAGKDLLVQVIQFKDSEEDFANPIVLAGIPVANQNKKTLYSADIGFMGYNPYRDPEYKTATGISEERPNFGFEMLPNPDLLYDAGVTDITHPASNNAAQANTPETVVVTFKNLGVRTINAAKITYQLDDETPVSYDWTGTLAGGASTSVTLTSNQQFTAGYHTLKAWVEDTITSAGTRYRDHEPYNDSSWVEFIACDGAMSGVRTVGGTNPDFETLDEFLFALSSCGIDAPLTVKLANGIYTYASVPAYQGGSVDNYVQFEPMQANGDVVFCEHPQVRELEILNLEQTSHVRFKDITFKRTNSNVTDFPLVKMGSNSVDCQFLNCTFINEDNNANLTALLESGGANQLLVDGCIFNGAVKGINLAGTAPTSCAVNNKIINSEFINQTTYALYIQNQTNIEIDSNYIKDIAINSGYAILMQDVNGASKVTRNKIYTSHGAAAIGVAGVTGSASAYAIVANNMIVANDDGSAISIVPPLNVQSASYVKFVYNSVQMNAPTRSSASAASFGGVSLEHCFIQNNAFVTLDVLNFAITYKPGTSTTNVIGNNIYYTEGNKLNRYNTTTCLSLEDWLDVVPSDTQSRNVNPSFLNGELVDLRTFSQTIKNIAIPIPEVTIDMFGESRHAVTPCVGAFEFAVLNYDFEIVGVDEPFNEYCGNPGQVPLRIKVYNWGSSNYTTAAGAVQIHYSYQTGAGTTTGFANVVQAINSADTTEITTGEMLSLPPLGREDNIYRIKIWIESTLDPNNTNDTIIYNVLSKYVSPAMHTINTSVAYNTAATITPTTADGLEEWNVTTFTHNEPSTIYWYESMDSEDTLHRGNTFVTDNLLTDTVFYISQHRELPMIRISEVMMDNSNNANGQMPIRPIWMNANTKVAIELTNVGDYPADLENDTLMITSNESAFRNKIFKFPQSLIIQPGASVVVQFRTGVHTPDSTITLSSNINISSSPVTKNLAVLYYHDGEILDAVATNEMTTKTQWTQLNVPTNVWTGGDFSVTAGTAGIRRVGWPAAGATGNASAWWASVDNENPLTMGQTDPNLIRYTDNGCRSPRSEVRVGLTNIPSIDLAIELQPMTEGCGLGNETVSAVVYNYGLQDCESATVHFSVGGSLVGTETVTGLNAGMSKVVNFSTLVNMHLDQDSLFSFKAWVEKNASEYSTANDTSVLDVMSLRTPEPPVVNPVSINYATSATLQSATPIEDSLVWYDGDMNVIDTTNVYVTEPMYAEDTFYVKSIIPHVNNATLATGTSQTAQNEKSSPYAAYYKQYKIQYIYEADELIENGLTAGAINALSFYLSDVSVPTDVVFSEYSIMMGATDEDIFRTSTSWENPDYLVYSAEDFTISSANEGWVTHTLTTPYIWDGQSNIVIQICRSLQTPNRKTVKTRYTTKSNTTLAIGNDTPNSQCDATSSGTRGSKRPHIQFSVVDYGCESDATEVPIQLIGVPDVDGFLSWNPAIDNIVLSSCAAIELPIRVRNMGRNPLTSYSVEYFVDGQSIGTHAETPNLSLGDFNDVNLPAYSFTPGRHVVKVILTVANDDIHSNDTIERVFPIRFCGGTYTIGTGMNYSDIASALDTLNAVGMDGSVIFNIATGTYIGQAEFGVINGASRDHTITFQSMSGNADDVILTAYPTNTNNYVVNINGSEYLTLRNLSIYSNFTSGSGNNIYASAVSLTNCGNVTIDSCNIKVRNTASMSVNSKGIIIKNGVTDLKLSNNNIDSSYCAIASDFDNEGSSHHILIENNKIDGFYNRGISVRKIHDLTILQNEVTGASQSNNRPLFGVYVAEHDGALSIEKNNIVLVDDYTGGKRGIVLTEISGSVANRARIINNMVALAGRGIAGLLSYGITIDSTSSYINVYYNTVRVATGNNATTTRAITIGDKTDNSTNINVRDNILSNFSQGYAYYVKAAASIATSDYNAIYSNSSANTPRFAYWGGDDYQDLASLQAASHKDANSLVDEPAFVSESDLHLIIGQYSASADYNADVVDDIDGNVRPQIPSPTIGAHEFTRLTRDVAVVSVLEPVMPENIHDHPNIEGKKIRVVAKFFNNGTVVENNMTWYAELVGHNLRSQTRTIATLAPRQYYYDTTFIVTTLGIIDTQEVAVHLSCASDMNLDNNDSTVNVFLDPAYNLQVVNVSATGGCAPSNSSSTIKIMIKNVGLDTITPAMPIEFGYSAYDSRGTTVLDNTLPRNITEIQNLTAILPPNASRTIILNTLADLYPHGIDSNFLALRIKGWVHYQYDLHPENDTTESANIQSYYTPQAPVGIDINIPYGTWDTLWASQRNNHAVEWYRDSTNIASRFNVKTNYTASCQWNNTPQYFDDSTYYLATTSTKGCKSNFSEISVHVNPRVAYDVSAHAVLQPAAGLKGSHVYNEFDTVSVLIKNYGTQSVSNIPITYSFSTRVGEQVGTVIQEVTETCTATIAAGQSYVYNFDSLLTFAEPLERRGYLVRAWVDLPTDMVRLNDTVRNPYWVTTWYEDDYYDSQISIDAEGIDITRLSFNTLHNEAFPMGYKYQNFGKFENPEIAPLHLTRGVQDTLIIQCINNTDFEDRNTVAKLGMWIDYNRNGRFGESYMVDENNEAIIDTVITVRDVMKIPITISENAYYGYMRMRILVTADNCDNIYSCGIIKNPTSPNDIETHFPTIKNGQVQDYLLYIDENAPTIDVALARVLSPYDHNVDTSEYKFKVIMTNKGATDVTTADIQYSFDGPRGMFVDTCHWTGVLSPGRSTTVTLPGYHFSEGTTDFSANVDVAGDVDMTNNGVSRQYHRYHVVILPIKDSFEIVNRWYAPQGANNYTRNLWQLGSPSKGTIHQAYSGDSTWVTDLTNAIAPGKYGNYSALYSPIFDISQIRPDTLVFMLSKHLLNGSNLILEFYNYANEWVKVELKDLLTWYDEDGHFTGSSNGHSISRIFPLRKIGTDFQQNLQFRFIYRAAPTDGNVNYGEGCAIDDFSIGRAPRPLDVGVVDIIEPVAPRYGETVYPKVVIKNFGTDTQHVINLAYKTHGSNLSRVGTWSGVLPPQDTVHYKFDNPFIVASDFPDTFQIAAFTTMSIDMYWDNDTIIKKFGLAPLDYDLNMECFVEPLNRVVAGDSIDITVRMRNFGQEPIPNVSLSYIFNHGEIVTEDVDLVAMCGGEGLGSLEYFNYTFKKRQRASLGYMALTAYGKYDQDVYIYNDTIYKRIEGITSISDLVASSVVRDTLAHQFVLVALVIDNQGSRAVNDFEVGFWYDNDTNTMVRREFHRAEPLASLETTTYTFTEDALPERTAPYDHICGYVHSLDDNDRSNDTTCDISTLYVDLKLHHIEVEENRDSTCAVRMVVENIGNLGTSKKLTMTATINGVDLKTVIIPEILPGRLYHYDMEQRIPKSATRQYVGSGSIKFPPDLNKENNQTSIIKVLNYFEDIPLADDNSQITLEQNYPNPFDQTTAIEFVIPEGDEVVFYVVDVMGRVMHQEKQFYNMGRNIIQYNASSLPSGTYYYGIIYNGERVMRKMIVK